MNMAPATSISRCTQCGAVLQAGTTAKCPKCGFDLHSCKQCAHFDPGSRFECRQPITARIPRKDEMNTCSYYTMSVRIERATTSSPAASFDGKAAGGQGNSGTGNFTSGSSNRMEDARRAFDALFKK